MNYKALLMSAAAAAIGSVLAHFAIKKLDKS